MRTSCARSVMSPWCNAQACRQCPEHNATRSTSLEWAPIGDLVVAVILQTNHLIHTRFYHLFAFCTPEGKCELILVAITTLLFECRALFVYGDSSVSRRGASLLPRSRAVTSFSCTLGKVLFLWKPLNFFKRGNNEWNKYYIIVV